MNVLKALMTAILRQLARTLVFPSPILHTCTHAGIGGCDAETTELLCWPETEANTTRTLQCPNTTTMISRTCSLSGVWEDIDLTLCTLFTSINTVSFNAYLAPVLSLNQGNGKS